MPSSPRRRPQAAGGVRSWGPRPRVAHIFASEASDAGGPTVHRKQRLFADKADMKRELMETLKKARYDVRDYYKDDGICQRLARHQWFESVTLAVIALNAVWIAIEVDLNDAPTLFDAHPGIVLGENAFCVFFFAELLIRLCAFRWKRDAFRDWWFCFDFVLVATMVVETWVLSAVFAAVGRGTRGQLGNATIVRLLKLLRLSRLARMIRLLRFCPELVILIKGILAGIRTVTFSFVILISAIYIFAIIFKQATRGSAIGETHFSSVPHGMHVLLLDGIFYDNLADLVGAIVEERSPAFAAVLLFLFYTYVLLAAITVMSMLTGIVVKVVKEVAQYEHEEMAVLHIRDTLAPLLEPHQDESTGEYRIDKQAFKDILDTPGIGKVLKDAEVDVISLVDLVDDIFIEDATGNERVLDFRDLITIVLAQRSSKRASKKNVSNLRQHLKCRMDRGEMLHLSTMLRIEASVRALGGLVDRIAGQEPGTVTAAARELLQRGQEAKLAPDSSASTGAVPDAGAAPAGDVAEVAAAAARPPSTDNDLKPWVVGRPLPEIEECSDEGPDDERILVRPRPAPLSKLLAKPAGGRCG